MTDPQACWLCERPFDSLTEWHHPVPRSKKGKRKVAIHPICHEAIHRAYTNSQLARMGEDRTAILAHPDIAKFVEWVKDKPPDFHAPTRTGGSGRR